MSTLPRRALLAAPLLAWGLGGTRLDPAARWPRVVTPMAMMVVELAVVWAWHLPAARTLADTVPLAFALEPAMFLIAGLRLWSCRLYICYAAVCFPRC